MTITSGLWSSQHSQEKPVHHGSGTRASWWPSKPRVYILGLGQRSPRWPHQACSHIRHMVLDCTWNKRMVMRSTGQTASHNRYDRQRKSMQSCTSAWHCHDGAHGQRPQMKQSRRSKVWPDSRQDARMRLPGVLRASRPWYNSHMSRRTTSLCQRPCDTKGVHGGT
jgi:hypothetical protein